MRPVGVRRGSVERRTAVILDADLRGFTDFADAAAPEEVTYGNVGTADRLDFTVIGPVVNEVSRLEGLCKQLDRQLLVSDSFLRAAPALRPQLRSLGLHRLRGVREAREVYTVD